MKQNVIRLSFHSLSLMNVLCGEKDANADCHKIFTFVNLTLGHGRRYTRHYGGHFRNLCKICLGAEPVGRAALVGGTKAEAFSATLRRFLV